VTAQTTNQPTTEGKPDALQAFVDLIKTWVETQDGQVDVVADADGHKILGVSLPADIWGASAERISLDINYTP